jgi:hypothetical protein
MLSVGMLLVVGCSDDNEVIEAPVDQAVEAGLDSALTTSVVPLVTFMGTMGDLLSNPLAGAVGGLACPDTSDWCTSGAVTCAVGVSGHNYDFDACAVVGGDLTLHGDVSTVPGATIGLTLTNLVVNGSPAISGTGTIDLVGCHYIVNMHTSGATVAGTVTQCDAHEYPVGNSLAITFGDFLVSVVFNGTSIAQATATQGTSLVANCTINLDSLVSSCDAP